MTRTEATAAARRFAKTYVNPDRVSIIKQGRTKMNSKEATAAARKFVKTYIYTNRQWDVGSVEGCLPDGYELRNVYDSDFFPPTVKNIARVIKNHAVRA